MESIDPFVVSAVRVPVGVRQSFCLVVVLVSLDPVRIASSEEAWKASPGARRAGAGSQSPVFLSVGTEVSHTLWIFVSL